MSNKYDNMIIGDNMNRKGFTLVELLAVIAILAILVIIALPNIMSMFNEARKNSFTTEIKEIYKVAQQQWISDSLFTTSEKVYSRCESCSGKSLDMSGRTQLEYYIKIDKGGRVSEYYASDGTYQYGYDSGDLKIEDINNIETIANLSEDDVISFNNNGAGYGDGTCRYKMVTDRGSFSTTSDVKEICINPVNDGYVYVYNYFVQLWGAYSSTNKYLVLDVYTHSLNDSSYIRVYSDSTKTQLLGEVLGTDRPEKRINLHNILVFQSLGHIEKTLGEYRRENVYVESSPEVNYSLMYSFNPTPGKDTYEGPWITDIDVINSIQNLETSLGDEYFISNSYYCDSERQELENCSPRTYYIITGTD